LLPDDAVLTVRGRTGRTEGGGLEDPVRHQDVRDKLLEYHWPGNVREPRNILERAAILCEGSLITQEHLSLRMPVPSIVARDAASPLCDTSGEADRGARHRLSKNRCTRSPAKTSPV